MSNSHCLTKKPCFSKCAVNKTPQLAIFRKDEPSWLWIASIIETKLCHDSWWSGVVLSRDFFSTVTCPLVRHLSDVIGKVLHLIPGKNRITHSVKITCSHLDRPTQGHSRSPVASHTFLWSHHSCVDDTRWTAFRKMTRCYPRRELHTNAHGQLITLQYEQYNRRHFWCNQWQSTNNRQAPLKPDALPNDWISGIWKL